MADRINQTSPGTKKVISSKKRLLVTIFIVSLMMVYAVLGMNYLGQLKEHKALASQLAGITQTLSEIPPPAENLEQRLAAAQTSLAAVQNSFPNEINTTQLINTILALANSCGVKTTPMITQPWSTEMVGEHTYPILQLTIEVEGSFSQLVAFASQLENGEYSTLVMKNLDISQSAEETEEGTTLITGKLKLAIYARSLSAE